MKVIHKYSIAMGTTDIYLQKGAKFLCVQAQHNAPQIWVEVDPEKPASERHTFVVLPTGSPVNTMEDMEYKGTFQINSGQYVGHVYERLVP